MRLCPFQENHLAGCVALVARYGRPLEFPSTRCFSQPSGPVPSISASVSEFGCRPPRIASKKSGATQLSGRSWRTPFFRNAHSNYRLHDLRDASAIETLRQNGMPVREVGKGKASVKAGVRRVRGLPA